MGLPRVSYADGIRKHQAVQFGGYNHNLYAGDGEIWDMENLTSDLFPLLSSRRPRYKLRTLAKPNGFYARDGLYWVDGTGFYRDGILKGTVTDGRKQFESLGAYIVILPDMAYYNVLTDVFGSINAAWSGAAVIEDGTYAGESAKANTIRAQDGSWDTYFKAGDAVTISGAQAHPENNMTLVIREIDGDKLRFYENSFVIGEAGDSESALTVSRTAPELDFICQNENRLWGCRGDEIYASKLGDIFNWNVFDGLTTDSYAVSVGSAGDFTAACSYLGYPVFFKEDMIYKVYGDRPGNFQVMSSASLGVEAGSHASLAIAGEILFYQSRAGIVAYSGGIPQPVCDAFGTVRYKNAVGGSNARKYYVSMEDAEGSWSLFAYDTGRGLWHREDSLHAIGFGWSGELHFLDADGNIWLSGDARTVPQGAQTEGPLESMAEFGDFVEADPNRKGSTKLQLRIEADAGAQVTVLIQFDSDGVWHTVQVLETETKKSFYLPIIPRRSDHFRLRLEGRGGWRLYSLVRESYSGSEIH